MSARTNAAILAMLLEHVTPGEWDVFGSWVSANLAPSEPDSRGSRSDPESHRFYNGELVCESVGRADALFIVAAKNLLPSIVAALKDQQAIIDDLARQLDYARGEVAEARAMVTLVRSERYAPPRSWLVPLGRVSASDNAYRATEAA